MFDHFLVLTLVEPHLSCEVEHLRAIAAETRQCIGGFETGFDDQQIWHLYVLVADKCKDWVEAITSM